MKNKMLLTLALGLAGAASVMATTVDVYITGSTAFRANVYSACQKLYNGGPSATYFGDSSHNGANSGQGSSTAAWVMTGTPVTGLTNLAGVTLNIHGNFTGSIQGIQTVEANTKLIFPNVGGVNTNGGLCGAYITNAPTIGFSDSSSAACPYVADGVNYAEEKVAVIPFVMCKSVGGSHAANIMTNITNVTWEQMAFGIGNGWIPLSSWTDKSADTNTPIYLLQRTLDSGTRRCETAQFNYAYNDTVKTFIFDETSGCFYEGTNTTAANNGLYPNGIVGPAGLSGVNLTWGSGYVGGGNIATALKSTLSSNTAISFLSFSDAKSAFVFANGQTNWQNVVSINGLWPTTAGAGIRGLNLGSANPTNDFSPITIGHYPLWGEEILVYPVTPDPTKQNITKTQLGTQRKPGSFLGVFNAQTVISTNLLGVPLAGSIENEIEMSKPSLATAIRLSDMKSNRSAVGGTIYPF